MIAISNRTFLYDTDRHLKQDFDCFYANIMESIDRSDGTALHTNYLTPYCRRLTSDDRIDEVEGQLENIISFKDLCSQGIRSRQLLQWSISVDIIEQYAEYLITNDSKYDEYMFYNCSLPWFGSHCQYTFDINKNDVSFSDIIITSFNNREQYTYELQINTCYPHLSECYRGPEPLCLDWREICNGIVDCIGDHYGIDEEYCEELELNECEETEYRCHNGAQCIPLEFFQDGWTSKDCLDGTDEQDTIKHSLIPDDYITTNCIKVSIFACEERSCRKIRSFPCGDGECFDTRLHDNNILAYVESCLGTSRHTFYHQIMYKTLDHLSKECRRLLYCKLRIPDFLRQDKPDGIDCFSNDWLLSNNCSMNYISFPKDPIFIEYFQIIYIKENLVQNLLNDTPPDYVCNHPKQCSHLPKTNVQINGLDCRPFEQVSDEYYINNLHNLYFALGSSAYRCASTDGKKVYQSNSSSLYYCQSSDKYISKHRILDGVYDCYEDEDEFYADSCLLNDTQRYSCTSETKCISPIAIGFDLPDCLNREDADTNVRPVGYSLLCDHIPDGIYEDYNEHDENHCQLWPCNNPYTRCDGFYQCANGIDELGCLHLGCAKNELRCRNVHSMDYKCIHYDYIYEKSINCNMNDNSTDIKCREFFYSSHLINDQHEYLSWKEKKSCLTDDDICGYLSTNSSKLFCNSVNIPQDSDCDRFITDVDNNQPICTIKDKDIFFRFMNFFSATYLGYMPSIQNLTSLTTTPLTRPTESKIVLMNTTIELIEYCNRGIVIYEGKTHKKKCLCPPSYFGSRCQWQNQRISLTLQINKMNLMEKNSSFYDIFIYLVDDHSRMIYSYEKVTYMQTKDCNTKYNRYLLYPTKPKDSHVNYSIHIDIYDKITLDYYASWYLSFPFQFLPVNRLATQVEIPSEKSEISTNCTIDCGEHGRCYNYVNSNNSFCYCDEGYTGRYCNITTECSCSNGSKCLNSSICLCSLYKYGSRCYLEHPRCQPNNPCQHNGRCIPVDDRIHKYDYLCLCSEDYMGTNCEYKSNRIDVIFRTDVIPSLIFAHYITAFDDKQHERLTTFKKVPFNEHSITLFHQQLFHVLFIEYLNHTYLTVLREQFLPSESISIDMNDTNLCVNISELFNSTILNYTRLHRYKYYQLPCMENRTLKCFYDNIHMCICDVNRFTNCFEFNHTMSYDCRGYNPCKNNGKCFQDNATCPQLSICMCEKCYYGRRCELTTKGFSLSLDVIFGYHIKPLKSFTEQSIPVKITTTITILMFILGFINGLLSILTFRRKLPLEVGCGIYLLINSTISLFTISIFTIKYCQLVIFQMNVITNRSFIYCNCLLTDMVLKVLFSFGDWLNACVAIERALTAVQGVSFNKAKSKSIAKRMIPVVFILTSVSYIHDPLYRRLFDDEDEQRTWCILDYSSSVKNYDRFISLFHFLVPFIVNIISALVIIIQVFRIRSRAQSNSSSEDILHAEIKRHKHLLISPIVLIMLACPRLVISLSSRCMESARDPWLFLSGYYISFVPPLLILVVFVLPSEKYRKEFAAVLKREHRTT